MKIRTLAWKVLNCLVTAAAVIALGAILHWQMFVLGVEMPLDSFGWLLASICFIPGIFAASILVHEMGHVLAALAGRMRISLVILGPLRIAREGGRFRLRIIMRRCAAGVRVRIPDGVA